MKTWNALKSELLSDSKTAREYEVLSPQYELAAQLIELRLKRGLTQADLARRIGTRQSAIARLESGAYNPSLQLLSRIAAATDSRLSVQLRVLEA